MDHRTDAVLGENFEQQGVSDPAVEDMRGLRPFLNGFEAEKLLKPLETWEPIR